MGIIKRGIRERLLGTTYILTLQWNGKGYKTEVKKPGLLSRDRNFYFSVSIKNYETIRTLLERIRDREGPMHSLVSKENRVSSNGGCVKFNIGNDGCDRLLTTFEVIERSIVSKPRNPKHKGLKQENIFKRYAEDVLGIRQPRFVHTTSRRPPGLKIFIRQKGMKKPFVDLTKKV